MDENICADWSFLDSEGELTHEQYGHVARALSKKNAVVFRDKFSKYYLKQALNLNPKTVIDVGVDTGTEGLYDAFSECPIVLVDPFDECFGGIIKKWPKHNFNFMPVAAGPENSEIEIVYNRISGQRGAFPKVGEDETSIKTKSVPVRRLDELMCENRFIGPYGIKIDVEGFELECLRGALGILPETEFLIVECAIKHFFKSTHRLSDTIGFLSSNGFEIFDVLNARGFSPNHFDILFLRSDHELFEPPS